MKQPLSVSLDVHQTDTRLSHNEISKMIEHIQDMNTNEHEQIFKILGEHSCRYTENLNGVFVNLAHVPNSVLHSIQSVILFWQDQQKHIQLSEDKRDTLSSAHSENDAGVVIHRSATNEASLTSVEDSPQLFRESTSCQKKLTQKELQIVRGGNAKKKKITLNKGGTDILKNGGSALRVAKKCLATDDDR